MRCVHIPPQPESPLNCALLTVAITVGLLVPGTAARQPKQYPLESTAGLRLHNVAAQSATLQGKKGLRITASEEAQRRLQTMTPDEQARFPQLAAIDGLEFANGVIEAEIAGAPAPGAGEGARGFVGIAFRLQNDGVTYDAFYLRPTNGRAEDQERRNHAVQYTSPRPSTDSKPRPTSPCGTSMFLPGRRPKWYQRPERKAASCSCATMTRTTYALAERAFPPSARGTVEFRVCLKSTGKDILEFELLNERSERALRLRFDSAHARLTVDLGGVEPEPVPFTAGEWHQVCSGSAT